MAVGWFTHLRLLIKKNFTIKYRHKIESVIEIVFPLLFYGMLLGIRSLSSPVIFKDPTLFREIPIGAQNIEKLRLQYGHTVDLWEIDYYPDHPLLETLINDAAKQLNLTSRGFNDPKQLAQFMIVNQSFAGVIFDIPAGHSLDNDGFPRDFVYNLRFPGSLRTGSIRDEVSTWETNELYPPRSQLLGPRSVGQNDGGSPGYVQEGFAAVQAKISSTFIRMAGNFSDVLPDVVLQRFPYPPYVENSLIASLEQTVGIIIVLSFLFPCVQTIKHVTVEKERQLKEAMKIMGLSTSVHWTAWFCTTFVSVFLIMVLAMIFLRVPWFDNFTIAVFTNTSWSLLLVFLLIYIISSITFCFMISSFFTKASISGPVGALSWFISYIPFSFTISATGMPLAAQLVLSLFSNTAMPFGCYIILCWETVNVGAQWENVFESPQMDIESGISVGLMMIMMIVDSILYMLITLYIEKIMPGAYGTAYKWYFPFTKSFWSPNKSIEIEADLPPISPTGDSDRHESEAENMSSIGVRLLNLKKKFGSKLAVDGFSVKMYEDQITVLLGHNGAGKTTTISMITGLLEPTSGTIIVNGVNLRKNFPEARKYLGFCPQYNILFDELTVEEHIAFYSRLKGLEPERIEDEVSRYLKILNLEDKRRAQSSSLSGGMKRKLSVGIALCGGSKVVLCDEPSSGMDPAARRSLWELLQAEKKGRTILLTTHLMDEADVLGDRIAIMSCGKLECSGTPFFLKKRFGTGYKLICSKQEGCDSSAVSALIQRYIPEASIKSDVGLELTYQLPEKYASEFEPMLRNLEELQNQLGLSGYGISMTTLEDVFLKTGTEDEVLSSKSNGNYDLVALNNSVESTINLIPTVSPLKHIQYQWTAMFFKKSVNFVRNLHLFAIQLLVPLLFIVLGIFISKTSNSQPVDLPPLTMQLSNYGRTVTLLRSEAAGNTLVTDIVRGYESMFGGIEQLDVVNSSIEQTIVDISEKNLQLVSTDYMVAATIAASQIVGWFNDQAYHTAPLALNLIYNAIAKAVVGPQYTITVINDPLPVSTEYQMDKLTGMTFVGFQLAINVTFAMAYTSSIFIMFIITERVSRSKLLQFVSGVRVTIYWFSHYLADLLIFIVVGCAVVLLMLALQQPGFTTSDELGRLFLIFLAYGFAILPLTYMVSFFFDEPATGLARLSLIHVLTGVALFILSFTMVLTGNGTTTQQVGMIFPNFALAQAIANQAMLEQTRQVCDSIAEKIGITVEEICAGISSECCDLNPFSWDSPGIGRPLVAMFGMGAAQLLLLLRRELASKTLCNFCQKSPIAPEQQDVDDDVQREKERVATMQYSQIAQQNLVMRSLTKFYKKFLAVNQISVAVDRGECFGLLGVNGAGKTTTFKMLTADEQPTSGDIWIEGKDIAKDRMSIYEFIGYCPQNDALLMDFTGTETLKLFAMLRGIPLETMEQLNKNLAVDFAFERHLRKKVKDYSGGNRRKLSMAVALLGNPYVIFLDEPTSGVDPASRRKLWDMVCRARDNGKAIILTSHSMEECEALCTRIAIMVNGEFKCIGSAQHLKNKFSSGITLSIKLAKIREEDLDFKNGSIHRESLNTEFQLDRHGTIVFEFVRENFEGATLKDYHKKLLTFDIPTNSAPYSMIFGLMESNKVRLHIEDYSLSQATLEQVFLQFSQTQRSA